MAAEAQSFDGPAPETINGRAAMLGVFAGKVLFVFEAIKRSFQFKYG